MKKYIIPIVEVEMIEEKTSIMSISTITGEDYNSSLELKVEEEAEWDIWND